MMRSHPLNHAPEWSKQKGGFPLNELYITVLMVLVLLGGTIFGYVTGNYIVVKVFLGFLAVLVVSVLVLSPLLDFFESRARSRREAVLYDDLIQLLRLMAEGGSADSIAEAEKRVRENSCFPARFPDSDGELLTLFRKAPLPLRRQVVDIMIRSVPFDLSVLETFLSTPLDAMSGQIIRNWIDAGDNLPGLVAVFQPCFEESSRGDQKELAAQIIHIAKSPPTPEYVAALKPFRAYLEDARRYYGNDLDRRVLDHYIECWDAEDGKGR